MTISNLTPQQVQNLAESGDLVDKGHKALLRGNRQEGIKLFQEALSKRKEVLGGSDAGVAEIMDLIGQVYLRTNQYDRALPLFTDASAIVEAAFYAGHFKLGPIVEHHGECLAGMAKWSDAEPLYKKALEIYEKTLSGEHRMALACMHRLANCYVHLGKYSDAEAILNKGLKNLETPLGPAEEFRYDLARVSQQLDKKKEADENFRLAIKGFEQRKNYSRLYACLKDYAEFLKKDSRPDEADAILKESSRYNELSASAEEPDDQIFPATLLRA